MISNPSKSIVLLAMIVTMGLSACSNPQSTEATPTSLARPTTTPSLVLATPYAQQPAAGICASFDGETVTVALNTDMPEPRCTRIRSDQKLAVVNNTLSTLRVSIGSFDRSLLPGETWSILVPFGDYLAVGVHQLAVTPCCSAELWLESK